MERPKVSVIIPTCNSAKYIHHCLHSIKTQTYPNIELIVVDNFSTDNTMDIARRYGAKLCYKGTERSAQLDYGIKLSTGKYIFETGSDMASDPTYIEEAIKKCEEGYDAIYSSVVTYKSNNFWANVKAMERRMYVGSDEIEAAHFFRRSIYDLLGGFDTSLISVEENFQHRLDKAGYKTGRIKARETHLHEATSLKEVAIKSFYYGSYIRGYLKKHPKRGSQYLFPLRKAFLKNWKEYVKHPILTIGFILYKFTQQTAGLLGLLFGSKKMHGKVYR